MSQMPEKFRYQGLPSREVEPRTPPDEYSRREAIKLLAASVALASGLPGCIRKPPRTIISQAQSPEYQHPGMPLYYASAWTEGQVPYGMMIRTVDGRPIKIEGLPGHPLNRGASSAQMQASLLSLYDPDRLRNPMKGKDKAKWADADAKVREALQGGGSVVLITRSSLGPSERAMVERFLRAVPTAKHFVHETAHDGARRTAWKEVYGADGEIRPSLSKARVILSLDADFLGNDGITLKNIRDFAQTRSVEDGGVKSMSRLWVAESGMSVTGSNADHRIPVQPSKLAGLAMALLETLEGKAEAAKAFAKSAGLDESVVGALASDLAASAGAAVVLAGAHLPAAVHAAAALLNAKLQASAHLEWCASPATLPVSDPAEIRAALEGGTDLLILLGVNPVYDWPGGGFEALLAKARTSVAHSLFADETARACTWTLASSHNLESWNDTLPEPGVYGLCQPVISPLWDTRQEAESLFRWVKSLGTDGELESCQDWHDFVRLEWKKGVLQPASDFEYAWESSLRAGIAGAKTAAAFPALNESKARELAGQSVAGGAMQLVIQPHHAVLDGRFGGSAWLQERPDPVSTIVWDNAAVLGHSTAAKLGVKEGDLVTVSAGGQQAKLPVVVQPGVAAGVVAVTLGHGRSLPGAIGDQAGFSVAKLLGAKGSATPRFAGDATVAPAGGTYKVVRLQTNFDMVGRPIVIDTNPAELAKDAQAVQKKRHLPGDAEIHASFDYSKGHKWGMSIDLNKCVGCNACMTACMAENNVPIVGKTECALDREMHWIRVDRYHTGNPDNPRVYTEPMVCMQCDNAPCELVCPVDATAHSEDGLNAQVYNRCVGTRYCANNCPYKVRHFNFYGYTGDWLKDPVQELLFNPRVTVRSRGVMEKCTFCIQRINEVTFKAKNEKKPVVDGAIRAACEQACPAAAISLGDLNDPASLVSRARQSSLAFLVLEDQNVRPNVWYKARVRNPHPDVHEPAAEGQAH
ncbi:MAG: 4Fe-4S dicluster domain-containing protein [Planctomycetia bacterium]|nr:4Fe-4S dicluster domain-containing protein [Planctomycetia bacterium]